MKITPEHLRNRLNQISTTQTDITRVQERLAACQAQLATLTIQGDLEDEKTIKAILRNQVLVACLPARVAAREEADAATRAGLNQDVENFITGTFGPRKRELRQVISNKVKAALAPLFHPEQDLSPHVVNSTLMREWFAIDNASSLRGSPDTDAVEYAGQILQEWEKFEALAARVATA